MVDGFLSISTVMYKTFALPKMNRVTHTLISTGIVYNLSLFQGREPFGNKAPVSLFLTSGFCIALSHRVALDSHVLQLKPGMCMKSSLAFNYTRKYHIFSLLLS